MKTLHDFCKSKRACELGLKFIEGMTIETFVKECERGDWMLWLGIRLNVDIRKFTLAKAHCANTVRHLMKDERSINAVDIAIKFGNEEATREELDAAAADATAAADTADTADTDTDVYAATAAADTAVYAADTAADTADTAVYAAADNAIYAAVYAATAAADNAIYTADTAAADFRKETLKKCADICREHIGKLLIEEFNKTGATRKK